MLSQKSSNHQAFQLYACLPFVELADENIIQLGPIIFWPASRAREFLNEKEHALFQKYLLSVGQIKARTSDSQLKFVHTIPLSFQATTCISISNSIPAESREFVILDSLYLLYFACTFRNLYFGQEVPSFDAFRKLIPASMDFIHNRAQWEKLSIDEAFREDSVGINLVDTEICSGLGKALQAIYETPLRESKEAIQGYKRLIRSIRYLVDRFFQRFTNLFDKGLNFSDELFEAEDVIFLASSFEALFDINEKHPPADFKHKLRPLLHLKYGSPVELFWKWVDDFYAVKRQIVLGDTVLDPVFRMNPNFEISHIFLGIKLFIYSVYYTLFQFKLIKSIHQDLFTPPDFKWIHPEEILVFFWTENILLKKLTLFLKQVQQDPSKEELYADIHLLSHLFVLIYERYYHQPYLNGVVRFIPASLSDLSDYGIKIMSLLKHEQLLNAVHERFLPALEGRLHEMKKQVA